MYDANISCVHDVQCAYNIQQYAELLSLMYHYTVCLEESDLQYFVHNFNKFRSKRIVVICGNQHRKNTAKLLACMMNIQLA